MSYPVATMSGTTALRVGCPSFGDIISSQDLCLKLTSYKQVDIVCYTFHTRLLTDSLKLNSIMCCKVIGELPKNHKFVLGLVSNIHSKLFVCKGNQHTDVFIGSWNFSPPSYGELMIKVRGREKKLLMEYRSRLWKEYNSLTW